MNEFDGVWEASAVDGRPVAQSRLNPIFISMEIADGKATLADGSIAQAAGPIDSRASGGLSARAYVYCR